MNKDIQQKLFNYFQQEHGIMLLDGDYNEIEHILKSELSSVLTDEEIEAVAQKRFPHKSIEHQKVLFIGGAKFARGIIEPSILTDKEIKEEADKLFIIPYKEKEKGFGHITTKRECWVRGAKFFRGTVVSVLTNEEIKTEAAKYAIERHGLGEAWQPDRCETIDGFIQGTAFAKGKFSFHEIVWEKYKVLHLLRKDIAYVNGTEVGCIIKDNHDWIGGFNEKVLCGKGGIKIKFKSQALARLAVEQAWKEFLTQITK